MLTDEDVQMTWGTYQEIAPHVFRRFDENGNKVFVLSAEKTAEIRHTNLITLALQNAVSKALSS